MTNEYTAPEVVEIGKAEEVILGPKGITTVDDEGPLSDSDLDD